MPGSSSRHNAPSPIGTRAQPVIIDYDDEDEDVPQHPFSCTTRQVTDIWRRVRKEPAILDLIYDENDASLDEQTSLQTEEAEARYERELEIIDLTEDQDVERPGPRRGSKLVSHAFLSATHDAVRAYRISGTKYKPGDCIELTNPIGLWTIQFVEIKSIWVQSSTGDVIFRGLPYSRALRLNGRLECKRNEVCQILIVNADDDRPDQAQLDIKPEQILCLRSLKKTNAAYPTFRYAGDSSWLSKPKTTQETLGPLTCRWKMLAQYRGRKLWRYDEGMVRLMEDDVEDSKFRVSDRESLKAWRDTDKIGPISPDGQKYTFCDIFSGCGGVTRGASMAGLKPIMSVDHWDIAHQSFQRNFPNVRTYNEDVFHFINRAIPRSCRRVDILHLSPPCQFFAPCHTHPGKNDERNTAALFACTECVTKLRPRLVLLEQTFGLVDRHSGYFNALVQGFTSLGYSVQWRVVHLVEYGLPQTRKRLIMIAACPGERLPPWPAPTHGPRAVNGLKAIVTEAAAFRHLRRNTNLHDIHAARRRNEIPRTGHMPFQGTIVCSGATKPHYDGTRDYTLRELACLQGFPLQHVFAGGKSAVIKQIGNAFAPCVVKAFLGHFRRCLERRDAVQTALSLTSLPSPQRPSSAASSVTMGFSPSPSCASPNLGTGSGSSLGKRKFKDVDDRPAKLEALQKRIREMKVSTGTTGDDDHDDGDGEPDIILLDKAPNVGSPRSKDQASRAPSTSSTAVESAATAPEQRDWTPFPLPHGASQTVSFPRKLWKLPATRMSSADWRL